MYMLALKCYYSLFVSTGGPVAQVRGLGQRFGGRLALFCIHRVNRVCGAVIVTSYTCYGAL